MGKWSKLDGTLPEAPQDQSERTQKLFAACDELAGTPVPELAKILSDAKQAKDAVKEAEKEANFNLEVAERAMIFAMKQAGIESIVVDGYRFTPSPEPYPQVTDKKALLDWALEHMRDNLSLHPSTLSAIVKQALEGQGELPPGVDVFLKRSVSRTKSK